MAKPNYSYEKRQRDLEKKRKQEEKQAEKRLRRQADKTPVESTQTADSPADETSTGSR